MYFFWLLLVTVFWTVFYGIITIIVFPIDFTRGKILSKIVKYWARTIFFSAGIKSKIIGLDNIDNSKNYIFAANHSSSLDIPLMLGYIPFWIVPVSKVELKWIPFLGWAMQMGGHVFVDRRNHEKAMSSLRKAKKSLLLDRTLGSYFFIGVLLLKKEIANSNSFQENHCGSCNECIEKCPTDAIIAPEIVDARRCISYLTIELRGPIPRDLRAMMGNHIFGCDICQIVCPWNEKAPETQQNRFLPRPKTENTNLEKLLQLNEKSFREKFQGTAILRAKYDGFLRNVLIAIGNSHKKEYLNLLRQTLRHRLPLVRGHSAWAIAEIVKKTNQNYIRFSLEERLLVEKDEWVKEEIELALGEITKSNKVILEVGKT